MNLLINLKEKTHFSHLSLGIKATPNTPIKTPEVEVIMLVNPSPNRSANNAYQDFLYTKTNNPDETPIVFLEKPAIMIIL